MSFEIPEFSCVAPCLVKVSEDGADRCGIVSRSEIPPVVVYSLRNGNAHYIGATVDLDRRIEQHNASRVGGAYRTAMRGPGWRCAWYVDGFSSFQQSLQFEYALKRETRSFGYTPAARLRAVRSLIDRWTMQKGATPMLCIQQ